MSKQRARVEHAGVPMYSWRADRRASLRCIEHHVAQAARDRATALSIAPEAYARQCGMMRTLYDKQRKQSIHQIARGYLEYQRMRAYMPGAYPGFPGDRPARDAWLALNPQLRFA